MTYLAAACAVLLGCLAIQYAAYSRLLVSGLRSPDLDARRRAMTRWVAFAVGWQALVVVAIVAYAIPQARSHPEGPAWIAPAVAAVIGTALPLQLAAFRIARAGRG